MTFPQIPVALEIGSKQVFASALDWPGWTRSAKNETAALEELLAYAPRYQRALDLIPLNLSVPDDLSGFEIAERLSGNATTDFGAPNIAPAADNAPLDAATLDRFVAILGACWDSLALAIELADGKQLRKGPRGGGRSAMQIFDHVVNAHLSYLRRLYWRNKIEPSSDLGAMLQQIKEADARALEIAVSGEMPEAGPRGGALWKPRYFARRAAWHILDHAWEIEDKIEP